MADGEGIGAAMTAHNILVVPLTDECKDIYCFFDCDQVLRVGDPAEIVQNEVVFLEANPHLKVARVPGKPEEFPRCFTADLVGPEGRVMENKTVYAALKADLYQVMIEKFSQDPALMQFINEQGFGVDK